MNINEMVESAVVELDSINPICISNYENGQQRLNVTAEVRKVLDISDLRSGEDASNRLANDVIPK